MCYAGKIQGVGKVTKCMGDLLAPESYAVTPEYFLLMPRHQHTVCYCVLVLVWPLPAMIASLSGQNGTDGLKRRNAGKSEIGRKTRMQDTHYKHS